MKPPRHFIHGLLALSIGLQPVMAAGSLSFSSGSSIQNRNENEGACSPFARQAIVSPLSGARFLSWRIQGSCFGRVVRFIMRVNDPLEDRYLKDWTIFFKTTLQQRMGTSESMMVREGIRHVVFLCPLATSTGGVPTFQRDVIETLLRTNRGLTIELLYLRSAAQPLTVGFTDRASGNSLILHGLPNRRFPTVDTAHTPEELAALTRETLQIIHARQPVDLLANNSSTPHFGILRAALEFGEAEHIPTHFFFHGGPILEGTRYLMQRSGAAATDSVFLRAVLRALGIDVDAVHPVGDLTFFARPLTRLERWKIRWLKARYGLGGRQVILHPARIARRKGQEDTVLAARDLRERYPRLAEKAVFVILGPVRDAGEGEHLRALAKEYGLNIIFVGEQTLQQLRLWFSVSDLVVYPTRAEEPFGLVPVEAQAAGTPVIVTESGGLPETLVNGRTGLLVKKQDPAALAEAIASLIGNKEQRRKMGRDAREFALTRYALPQTAAELTYSYLSAAQAMRSGEFSRRPAPEAPAEPLRVLSDGYGGVYQPGDILKIRNRPAGRALPADTVADHWRQRWLSVLESEKPRWTQHSDSPVSYDAQVSALAYDPAHFPSRSVGPFIGVVMPPIPERTQSSITREQAAANPDRFQFGTTERQTLAQDSQDQDLLVRINLFPKRRFHSLLTSRVWRPQRLMLQDVLSQLRWVRRGAYSEFHRSERFINHLHLHLYAKETVPIIHFAESFSSVHREGDIEIGRLEYPIPHIALTSNEDNALARATIVMADWLDGESRRYIEPALEGIDGRVITLFMLWTGVLPEDIAFTPCGIVQLPSLETTDAEVWSAIRRRVVEESHLAPLRQRFRDLLRAA